MTAPRKVALIEETPGSQDESAGLNDRPSPPGPTRQMYRGRCVAACGSWLDG